MWPAGSTAGRLAVAEQESAAGLFGVGVEACHVVAGDDVARGLGSWERGRVPRWERCVGVVMHTGRQWC